jgi:hypothetical protein
LLKGAYIVGGRRTSMQVPARVQSTADSVITTVDSLSAFAIPTRVQNRVRRWEETYKKKDGKGG